MTVAEMLDPSAPEVIEIDPALKQKLALKEDLEQKILKARDELEETHENSTELLKKIRFLRVGRSPESEIEPIKEQLNDNDARRQQIIDYIEGAQAVLEAIYEELATTKPG